MAGKRSLICGIGINDADYVVSEKVDGKYETCPYYQKWVSMFKRCYCKHYQKDKPSYIGCSVCEEWIKFMTFKAWMVQQEWDGRHLEKDILFPENKVYSPETCVFVTPTVNGFVLDCSRSRGDTPIGVTWNNRLSKYVAQCSDPFTARRTVHLGCYDCPQVAHQAWRTYKHSLALRLANELELTGIASDLRVAAALRTRYL